MRKSLPLLLSLLFIACVGSRLPKEKFPQTNIDLNVLYESDSVFFAVQNPLHTPIRISISSEKKEFQDLVKNFDTLTLGPQKDTLVKISAPGIKKPEVNFNISFGDLRRKVDLAPIGFPFPKHKPFKIIQGHNGSFSHTSDYSRYAIDFNMKIGDTVHSAADGFVVGVIKDYKKSGSTPEWRDYANFITLYHPGSGLYTQYVHLMYLGAFVEVGEEVKKGQPIGIVGLTGYTTGPHLHFNVLRPGPKNLVSLPVEFEKN